MCNSSPGSPDYKIVSMRYGFHGRGLGTLSLSNTKSLHKVGIPALNFPKLDFPNIKYPLNENDDYNRNEENKCLDIAYNLLSKDKSIAALIIEPILAEGGDKQASN